MAREEIAMGEAISANAASSRKPGMGVEVMVGADEGGAKPVGGYAGRHGGGSERHGLARQCGDDGGDRCRPPGAGPGASAPVRGVGLWRWWCWGLAMTTTWCMPPVGPEGAAASRAAQAGAVTRRSAPRKTEP